MIDIVDNGIHALIVLAVSWSVIILRNLVLVSIGLFFGFVVIAAFVDGVELRSDIQLVDGLFLGNLFSGT